MKAPKFWYLKESVWCRILKPFGKIYGWSVERRFKRTHPYQADIPVICVGNLSVGGTGKTPVCLALGKILKQKGIPFFFLNHGYKSRQRGVFVDKGQMTALDVGDEALLLAEMAPTVVDNKRARGAQMIQKMGAKALIMDDGFQNPSLIKTVSFIVVDGHTGFGNGCLIPAGPLREPINKGLQRADAVIIAGRDETGVAAQVKQVVPEMPILMGHFEPDKTAISKLQGEKVLAFAGIGRPNKFFNMLKGAGIPVAKQISFPDHYFYTRFDMEEIMAEAAGLPILTTTKDFVKVPKDIQSKLTVIKGEFVFDKPAEVESLLKGVLSS